eukprot:scaffold825_cov249-Pinguiococcus_pyrenoidosus.AAC.55
MASADVAVGGAFSTAVGSPDPLRIDSGFWAGRSDQTGACDGQKHVKIEAVRGSGWCRSEARTRDSWTEKTDDAMRRRRPLYYTAASTPGTAATAAWPLEALGSCGQGSPALSPGVATLS